MKTLPDKWTVHNFVDDGLLEDPTDAGLFEIEEINKEILDLARNDNWDKVNTTIEQTTRLIAFTPILLKQCRHLISKTFEIPIPLRDKLALRDMIETIAAIDGKSDKYRPDAGVAACKYCNSSIYCDYDCDESQADGFSDAAPNA